MDALLAELSGVCAVDGAEAEAALAVEAFVTAQAFDTESFKLDVQLCGDDGDGDSNVRRAAEGSQTTSLMGRLLRFVRRQRVTAQCFSTGTLFWYWPFYGTADADTIKTGGRYKHMDFGGHSVRETFVRPYFGSLKEELLGSRFIDAVTFREDIVEKGDRYVENEICRKMRSGDPMFGRDRYHFDIVGGSPLRAHHLYAVIAYCDFTDFCTAFSRFPALRRGLVSGIRSGS